MACHLQKTKIFFSICKFLWFFRLGKCLARLRFTLGARVTVFWLYGLNLLRDLLYQKLFWFFLQHARHRALYSGDRVVDVRLWNLVGFTAGAVPVLRTVHDLRVNREVAVAWWDQLFPWFLEVLALRAEDRFIIVRLKAIRPIDFRRLYINALAQFMITRRFRSWLWPISRTFRFVVRSNKRLFKKLQVV